MSWVPDLSSIPSRPSAISLDLRILTPSADDLKVSFSIEQDKATRSEGEIDRIFLCRDPLMNL
jgi:hypothetical protein